MPSSSPYVSRVSTRPADLLITNAHSDQNHGGRQLEFAPPPIHVLQSIRSLHPELLARDSKFEVYLDGSIRRGTDVLKALCLGARGVGLGRTFLYAQSAWGKDGVAKAVESEHADVLCDHPFSTSSLS